MPLSHLTLIDRRRTYALVARVVWADSRLVDAEVEALFAAAMVLGVDARISAASAPEPLELPETAEARRVTYAVATWIAAASPFVGAPEAEVLGELATRLGIEEDEAASIGAETMRASAAPTRVSRHGLSSREREVDLRAVVGWVLYQGRLRRDGST